MYPYRTVRVGRNEDVTDAETLYPIRLADHDEGGRLGRDTQHFHGQGRSEHTVNRNYKRNPAHDATARIDAQKTMTRRCRIQLLQAAQCSREMPQMRGRIGSEYAERGSPVAGTWRSLLFEPRNPERHRMPAQWIGQTRVIPRHLRQTMGELGIQLLDEPGDARRRHAVEFRH